jgi:hypothetical protein
MMHERHLLASYLRVGRLRERWATRPVMTWAVTISLRLVVRLRAHAIGNLGQMLKAWLTVTYRCWDPWRKT